MSRCVQRSLSSPFFTGPLVALLFSFGAAAFTLGALGACSSDTGAPPPDSKVPIDAAAVDQLVPPDQAPPDQDPPDQSMPDATVCSVVGKWQGTGDGVAFTIEFLVNGKSDYTVPTVPTNGGGGSWSINGSELTWETDRQDCDAVPATYMVSFSADCNNLTFTVVKDDCAARKMAYDGATFPRA